MKTSATIDKVALPAVVSVIQFLMAFPLELLLSMITALLEYNDDVLINAFVILSVLIVCIDEDLFVFTEELVSNDMCLLNKLEVTTWVYFFFVDELDCVDLVCEVLIEELGFQDGVCMVFFNDDELD